MYIWSSQYIPQGHYFIFFLIHSRIFIPTNWISKLVICIWLLQNSKLLNKFNSVSIFYNKIYSSLFDVLLILLFYYLQLSIFGIICKNGWLISSYQLSIIAFHQSIDGVTSLPLCSLWQVLGYYLITLTDTVSLMIHSAVSTMNWITAFHLLLLDIIQLCLLLWFLKIHGILAIKSYLINTCTVKPSFDIYMLFTSLTLRWFFL